MHAKVELKALIIDSSFSNHMIGDKEKFINIITHLSLPLYLSHSISPPMSLTPLSLGSMTLTSISLPSLVLDHPLHLSPCFLTPLSLFVNFSLPYFYTSFLYTSLNHSMSTSTSLPPYPSLSLCSSISHFVSPSPLSIITSPSLL